MQATTHTHLAAPLSAVIAVLVSGCGGAPAPGSTQEAATVGIGPGTRDDALAAGDRALTTVLVWPSRWASMTHVLTSLDPTGGELAAAVPPLEGLLTEVGGFLDNRLPEGLDPDRPIILRMREGEDDLLATMNAIARGEQPPSLRTVVVFPALDAAVLQRDLEARIAQQCPGAPARCGDFGRTSLRATETHVFVVFDENEPGPVSTLLGEPGPALRWAMGEHVAFAGHLRASAQRAGGLTGDANVVHAALATLQGDDQERSIRAFASSELVSGYLLASPHGRELSDLAIAVEDSPPRVRFAARMTSTGEARVSARLSSAAPPSTGAPIRVHTQLDLRALTEAAELPFSIDANDTTEFVERVFASGGRTSLVAAASSPFAFARSMRGGFAMQYLASMVDIEVDTTLPTGTVNLDVDPAGVARAIGAGGAVSSSSPLHLRSRVEGASWTGVISRDPSLTVASASFSAVPDVSADTASLVCLERLGIGVRDALDELSQADASITREAVDAVRAEAARHRACVVDPSLAPEADGYLAALQMLPAR